jgi:hypothetical protein
MGDWLTCYYHYFVLVGSAIGGGHDVCLSRWLAGDVGVASDLCVRGYLACTSVDNSGRSKLSKPLVLLCFASEPQKSSSRYRAECECLSKN